MTLQQRPDELMRTPFEAWFAEQWKQPTETRTRALARLESSSGLAMMTLRRAMKGLPLRLDSASKLSTATAGAIATATLVLGANSNTSPEPRAA